jgi:hypothetical protein
MFLPETPLTIRERVDRLDFAIPSFQRLNLAGERALRGARPILEFEPGRFSPLDQRAMQADWQPGLPRTIQVIVLRNIHQIS